MGCCVHCGREWPGRTQPGFRETCPDCDAYLHSCQNCRLYNRRADQCSSVTAECPGQRDHYNYCQEYQIARKPLPGEKRKPDGKTEWRTLFGDQ